MASKNKLTATKYGYGTIGADVFFSIADIHKFGDIIARIQDDDTKELAIVNLMHLHDKLIAAISSSEEDSLFNPQTDGEDEL